jgi:hypothetical protein
MDQSFKKIEDTLYLLSVSCKEATNNQGNKIALQMRVIMMQQRTNELQNELEKLESEIALKLMQSEKNTVSYLKNYVGNVVEKFDKIRFNNAAK